MGCEMNPMQGYLNSFAYGLAHFGREDLAIDLFNYNIELHPEQALVYNNLGYYYKNNGNSEKAIEMYSQSLVIQPDEWVSETLEKLKNR